MLTYITKNLVISQSVINQFQSLNLKSITNTKLKCLKHNKWELQADVANARLDYLQMHLKMNE